MKLTLLMMAAFIATLTSQGDIFAAILSSRIEVALGSETSPANGTLLVLSGSDEDSQGATTNPLSASFSQLNSNGSIVDASVSANATFAGESRGTVTQSYEVGFSQFENGAALGFRLNALGKPLAQIDFVADSAQLNWGFSYNQQSSSTLALLDLPSLTSVTLRRKNDSGLFIQDARWNVFDLYDGGVPSVGVTAETGLVQGETYRLEVDNFAFASGAFGPNNTYSFDSEFVWTLQGESQSNPLLPDSFDGEVFAFQRVPTGNWYDPPVATGYDFQTTDGSLFTNILDFPIGFNSPFTVVSGGVVLGQFGPGESVDFEGLLGSGVPEFSITGIDPGTNPEDSLAFPIQLEFDNAIASFDMSPTGIQDSDFIVPEAASFVIWLAGGLVSCIVFRRSRGLNS